MLPNLLSDPVLSFNTPPARVVSLVPSITASLFDLGLGHVLVAVTDYCCAPDYLPRIGGPKTPNVNRILDLQPDLVIANQEENDRGAVESLAAAGIPVWLTFPITVRAAVDDLWTLANLFRSPAILRQVELLEKSVEWAQQAAADQPALRCFCPIWQADQASGEPWWMTFNQQTYPSDLLHLFNVQNVFANRIRRYPLLADLGQAEPEDPAGRDVRYPCVTREEIIQAQPEIILLPSEPYEYSAADIETFTALFANTPAAQTGRILALDGTLLTWHGTRLARALDELPGILG